MNICIGISTCFLTEGISKKIFNHRPVYFMESALAQFSMKSGACVIMIPPQMNTQKIADLTSHMDGLILHGGADISPTSYGEKPQREEWKGDSLRDEYELDLFSTFLKKEIPILGICRGAQIINVAQGGTLYQDIALQTKSPISHRDAEKYEKNTHEVHLLPDHYLTHLYGKSHGTINSVHHQGIKDVGKDISVEALCPQDNIIEAIRIPSHVYCLGIQWHPEFQNPEQKRLLPAETLIQDFTQSIIKRKKGLL